MSQASIAMNRFGLGARPDDRPGARPQAWLIDQFARYDPRPPAIAAQPATGIIAAQLADYTEEVRVLAQQGRRAAASGEATEGEDAAQRARQFARQQGREHYTAAVGARAQAAVGSATPFVERMVHFWANHFAVSSEKITMTGLTGAFEFDAIRPHVLGRFRDMLHAVERHPAMLLYLDQAQSIGPGSPAGQAAERRQGPRRVGLNENLAREILELHTLGVRTGYSQGDVTEFARAMTGWSVAGLGRGPAARMTAMDGELGEFIFAPRIHEPGARTILGKIYDQQGERQAAAVLDDLAAHPATARHIATKLARHFAGDEPPAPLVARLEAAFLASGGDLPTLYKVLIDAPEAWVAAPVKFRNPWEWSIATMRALDTQEIPAAAVMGLMEQLGQPVWRPGSPAGYDDIAASWAGPDAVMRRVEAAERRDRPDHLGLGEELRQPLETFVLARELPHRIVGDRYQRDALIG
ncbi:MAG: DUF1800 domain-containing protein [Alphaproteobacteria bacterium HGW-Alphaproteobacteria-15]|nr:MAG: DUF1800 domain-containing protein [Alphaproteobacteria bacterium HGW-Alphaproteobacteria-15]